MPSERFTFILIVCIVCAVVDCEIEGVGVCTGRAWLGMVVGIDAAFCVVLAIPVVGVAGCDMIGSIVMVANCQVHGVCAWAVVGVDVVVNVCACLGICTVVPCKRIAGILIVGIVCAVVDCEI